MDRVLLDLKFVIRSLLRSPLFTVVALASLALGIGANSAIFSLLDQVLLRSLPVQTPEQLVAPKWKGPFMGMSFGPETFSYPMYSAFRDKTGEFFDGVLARFGWAVDLSWKGVAERTNAELVSGNYFQVLGVQPAIGRMFTQAEDRVRDGAPYVVLSYGYWQKRFGGNPGILNQTVGINSHPMTVVGVAPPGFRGTDAGSPVDVFVPMTMKRFVTPTWNEMDNRQAIWLTMLARLKPGVSTAQAQAAATLLFRQQQKEDLNTNRMADDRFRRLYMKDAFWLAPAANGFSSIRDQFSTPLIVLMCMVGTLLLIACGNVANLLVARASARQKEIAVRLSLGAGAGTIIRMVLIEALVLSLAGGALALLVSSWSTTLLLRVLPFENFANVVSTSPDGRMIGFTLLLSAVTALLFGLTPALQIARPDLMKVLKNEARSVAGGPIRFRKGMVTAQIALSLLLLIGAGLFARSLYNLMQTDAGMKTDHVVSCAIDPSLSGYTDERSRQTFERLQAKLAALPGVEAASGSTNGLLSQDEESSTISAQGHIPKDGEDANPTVNHILPGFFSAMGIPFIAGREFTTRDHFGAPKAAIVNERFARQYFGHENPLGRHIGYGMGENGKFDMEIVGVVKPIREVDLKEKAKNQVWVPALADEHPSTMTFYVRTAMDPANMSNLLRQSVRQLDPGLPIYKVKTLDTQIRETHYVDRLISMLSAAFGIVATLLAGIGLYGVMAFTVARRTPELGIRMALGAQRSSVLRMIMLEVALLIAIGVGVALPTAFALGHYLRSQLFDIRPNDPVTMISATVILIAVALLAGYIPARRATRIDPMAALRWE